MNETFVMCEIFCPNPVICPKIQDSIALYFGTQKFKTIFHSIFIYIDFNHEKNSEIFVYRRNSQN